MFGLDNLPEHDGRYAQAEEALQVIEGLWQTHTGEFDFQGQYYNCSGRLAGPHPVQQSPLMVNAGASGKGREFAATHADYSFASVDDFAKIPEIEATLARIGNEAGRTKPAARVLFTCSMVVDSDRNRAQDEWDEYVASIDDSALAELAAQWSKGTAGTQGAPESREEYKKHMIALVGTAEDIAERLIDAHRNYSIAGMIMSHPIWGAERIHRDREVFALLEKAGCWLPPEQRGHSW